MNNYVKFRAFFIKCSQSLTRKVIVPECVIKEQFKLMRAGVRDIRLHDTTCAWITGQHLWYR